jgi:hypothetical protein
MSGVFSLLWALVFLLILTILRCPHQMFSHSLFQFLEPIDMYVEISECPVVEKSGA